MSTPDTEFPPRGGLVHFTHDAMACTFAVYVARDDARRGEQAAAAAFAEVDRLEGLLSRFIPYSDIARLSALEAGQATRVSPETLDCLRLAAEMFAETDGAFDIAFRSAPAEPGAPPPLVFDPQAHAVGVTRGGVRLDLGALGKGYAVDRIVALLREWGIAAALVHSGQSTVYALGTPADAAAWRLALRNPEHPDETIGSVALHDAALSGSGLLRQGKHIIDPRTRQPAQARAAWVVAPTAARSDALSTALMVTSPAEAAAYCARHPDISAILMPATAWDIGGQTVQTIRRIHVALGVMVLGSALGIALAGDPPAEQLAKIRAAAPEKAPAKPLKARRLLVYTGVKGFAHSSIPCAAAAVRILGEKTGAFETVISDDPAVFKPDSLAKFDGVCFDNTTGELFDEDEWKQGLLDFVRNGKGIVGMHAATDCFYQWLEFGELMGGYFDGHPWNETVGVKIDDPQHPVAAAFGGKTFEIADEIYQFKEPYTRDHLRVLLSLDTTKTDMTKAGIKRSDGDFAVSWVRNYGLGRLFFCSLGHREDIFWNTAVLQHYLAGIQFALGDLAADATPSAQLLPDGQIRLFNGKDLTGWIAKSGSWVAEDGVLVRKGGGDIWTEQPFGDFVLDLEFKIAEKTNSGIFFRTADIKDCVQTGIELQVLDSTGKAQPDKHDCGAIYDCLAPSQNTLKPIGEWNHVVLTCKGNQIQAELNGEKIIDMDLDRWTEAGKNPDGTPNKFKTAYKDMPRIGRIGFQDHGSPVWYRSVRIKRL